MIASEIAGQFSLSHLIIAWLIFDAGLQKEIFFSS